MNDSFLYSNFLSSLQNTDKDTISIICHDQPDPDCLASAMALRVVAEHFGKNARIYYGGELGHTQNRIMVNVLDMNLVKLDSDEDEDSTENIKSFIKNSFIAVVDTSNFKSENCSAIKPFVDDCVKPDLVIDHHEINPQVTCDYIRKPYGACSTIMYEILNELELPISKILATALYLGINTDTSDLNSEGAADEDQAAYESLKSKIDLEKFLSIFNYPKPSSLLDLRKRAYHTISTHNNLAVANVGVITPQQRSLVAELCEEFLEIESIETAVVMAVTDEGLKSRKNLVASFRSGQLAINTKDFMSKIFGKKGVGGRKGAGGASIPLDFVHCDVIDSIRSNHGDNGHLSSYVDYLFSAYASKIQEEKENV